MQGYDFVGAMRGHGVTRLHSRLPREMQGEEFHNLRQVG